MDNDNFHQLKAISILDGRNWDKMEDVRDYFSEFALMKYRVKTEILYIIFLSENTKIIPGLGKEMKRQMNEIWQDFSKKDAHIIKQHEAKINHDVKAVEYFLRDKFSLLKLSKLEPFIHIGLTSYDVNIPAYAQMLDGFRKEVLLARLGILMEKLSGLVRLTSEMSMLGRTHGQPALPTTMGKELAVFYQRLKKEFKNLYKWNFEAKLTGAVGNYNALSFVYPQYDWLEQSRKFIRSLSLSPNVVTTQIIPYDNWLAFFDSVKRTNYILNNLAQDMWWYISLDYFHQKKKEEEVGSSTMSHKVNPITFENAEGNLQLANTMFEFFGRKLSSSRLQRDLSDSTIKRDFGLAFGFTLLAWDSLLSGFSRVSPNKEKMEEDLDSHWEIFSEGLQTYLRSCGGTKAFELLKDKTRGNVLTRKDVYDLIDGLPIKKKEKEFLKIDSLKKYQGLTKQIIDVALSTKEE
ncbi:adenylosuccinate lyase [Patescibacteria group bacterium]|nr:adenylosuccinate lyase [Patescibacteria group bacterium]MCL5797744.1 adenylosuccinate lyase [Patescibacteria group bacterium]